MLTTPMRSLRYTRDLNQIRGTLVYSRKGQPQEMRSDSPSQPLLLVTFVSLDDNDFTAAPETSQPLADSGSMRALFPRVYRELKAVARRQLVKAPGHSLDTTGLVHEVYFKLADLDRSVVADRAHFLAISAHAMRQVLVAAARKRKRIKRGSGQRPVTLDEAEAGGSVQLDDVLAVNEALDKLQRLDARLAQVVECRFFAGLTEEESAEALGISISTLQRDWRRARAWLRRYLEKPE